MSPAERVQTFINQIIVWEAAFHTERKTYHDTCNTDYKYRIDADAKAQSIDISSENLSLKTLNALGATRLDTLGTERLPEYDQAILVDTETRSGAAWTVEIMKFHGIKYALPIHFKHGKRNPRINGVNTRRDSAEKWWQRNAT